MGPEVAVPRAPRVGCSVDLGIGVAQLDGDVALQLVLEAHRLDARDGFDHSGLAVGHMPDRSCTCTAPCSTKRATEPPQET